MTKIFFSFCILTLFLTPSSFSVKEPKSSLKIADQPNDPYFADVSQNSEDEGDQESAPPQLLEKRLEPKDSQEALVQRDKKTCNPTCQSDDQKAQSKPQPHIASGEQNSKKAIQPEKKNLLLDTPKTVLGRITSFLKNDDLRALLSSNSKVNQSARDLSLYAPKPPIFQSLINHRFPEQQHTKTASIIKTPFVVLAQKKVNIIPTTRIHFFTELTTVEKFLMQEEKKLQHSETNRQLLETEIAHPSPEHTDNLSLDLKEAPHPTIPKSLIETAIDQDILLQNPNIRLVVPPIFLLYPQLNPRIDLIRISGPNELVDLDIIIFEILDNFKKLGKIKDTKFSLWLDCEDHDLLDLLPMLQTISDRRELKLIALKTKLILFGEDPRFVNPNDADFLSKIPDMPDLQSLSVLFEPINFSEEDNKIECLSVITLFKKLSPNLTELNMQDFLYVDFELANLENDFQTAFNRFIHLHTLNIVCEPRFTRYLAHTPCQIKNLSLEANFPNLADSWATANNADPRHNYFKNYISFLENCRTLETLNVPDALWPNDQTLYFEPLFQALTQQKSLQNFKIFVSTLESLDRTLTAIADLSEMRDITIHCRLKNFKRSMLESSAIQKIDKLNSNPRIKFRFNLDTQSM